MNITELRYLVAIRKWGSVSAAAKQLYAAQPNVSKALKNLEEEYGIRIFERSSTGMIPTEQGRHFIRQAERVLDEVDRLDLDARSRQSSCAELRVVLPHATYASYATVDFLQQMADSQQLRVHIRESGSMEALDHVLRRGYHLALLRYAEEDEDYYRRYCDRHGLHREPVMEFEYRLLTNREGPLAKCEVSRCPGRAVKPLATAGAPIRWAALATTFTSATTWLRHRARRCWPPRTVWCAWRAAIRVTATTCAFSTPTATRRCTRTCSICS